MSEALADEKTTKSPKTVTIFVNTRPHEVEKNDTISFEELVAIAFPEAPDGDNIGYSVMYQRGHANQGGALGPGQSVKIKDGMRFDVTATDRS
jgi:hypothetical protein